VYEGWIIVDGAPVSTGTFSVDESGVPGLPSYEASADEAANATAFVLTIEPDPDADPGPSATKLLGGDFMGGVAELTVGHGAALMSDFTKATGSYILQTPSTAGEDGDYDQGIWWLDPQGAPDPGLILPTLPAGWMYEGWIVADSGPISTGRFAGPNMADSDGAGPDAGPDPAPPFPGQDFIDPPLSLIDLAAVITVEPEPDDSPEPFILKPLVDDIVEDVGLGGSQEMVNRAAMTNPTGTASFE
jgi:hypothetical protein